jgi:hypothetical protein
MDSPRVQKSRGGKTPPEPPPSPESPPAESAGSDPKGAWGGFEQAYQRLASALQEAYAQAQRESAERHRQYTLACQEAQLDTQAKAGEAYRTYARSLHEMWGKEEAQKDAEEAHRTYTEALRNLEEEQRRRVGEAWQGLSAQKEGERGVPGFEEAYRGYVQELRDAWSRLDVGSVDPALLAAIAQSLSAAAWSAQNALGQGR